MAGDENEVVVVGSDRPFPAQPRLRPGGRFAVPFILVLLVTAVLVVLVGHAGGTDAVHLQPVALTEPATPGVVAPPVGIDPLPTTTDGWETGTFPAGGTVTDVVAGPSGWMALVAGESTVAFGSDDGLEWAGVPLPAPVRAELAPLAAGNDAVYVLVVPDGPDRGYRTWVSSDLAGWNEVGFPDSGAIVARLITTDAGVFVVGTSVESGRNVLTVWSLRGDRWERLSAGVRHPEARIVEMEVVGGRLLAVGEDEDGLAVWEVSDDLLPLEVVPPAEVSTSVVDVVVDSGGTAFVLTHDGFEWFVLQSDDLRVWKVRHWASARTSLIDFDGRPIFHVEGTGLVGLETAEFSLPDLAEVRVRAVSADEDRLLLVGAGSDGVSRFWVGGSD